MKFHFLLLFFALAGCMVGPNYQTPEMALPEQFTEIPKATTSSSDLLTKWWEQFQDPFLNALIEEACHANFDFKIALEQILQSRAQYKIQSSKLWPQIDLNAAAIRSRNSQSVLGNTTTQTEALDASSFAGTSEGFGGFGPAVQNFFQVGFDAIWELDFFGKFRRGKKAAYEEWEASKDNAQSVLITAISEVARDYVAICALQHRIKVLQEKISTDQELLALRSGLFEAGLDSEQKVMETVALLESERALLPQLQSALKQTIYALAVLVGRSPESLVGEFEEIRDIPSGMDKIPVGLPSDLLRRRPDVRFAERTLAAATERIGVAVADFFPHISLTGDNAGYASDKLNQWFKPLSRYWNIGPSINWNLIDFGRVRGAVDVAKSLQRQALISYEKAVITSLQDVEGSLVAYFEEQKRLDSLTEKMQADLKTLQLTESVFEAGLSSELEVLQAYRLVLDSESSLIDSQQAVTSDLIGVYKALGGDW